MMRRMNNKSWPISRGCWEASWNKEGLTITHLFSWNRQLDQIYIFQSPPFSILTLCERTGLCKKNSALVYLLFWGGNTGKGSLYRSCLRPWLNQLEASLPSHPKKIIIKKKTHRLHPMNYGSQVPNVLKAKRGMRELTIRSSFMC